MRVQKIKIGLTGAAMLALLLGGARQAEAVFFAADFLLEIIVDSPFFEPGDVVTFDLILTNLSSDTVIFDTNLDLNSRGVAPRIAGIGPNVSPYSEGAEFAPVPAIFSGGILAPGASVQFDHYSIDTTSTIPPGTPVQLLNANLDLNNIPRSAPSEIVDFRVFASNTATSVATPEPSSFLLLGTGLIGLLGRRRRFHS